MNIPLGSRCISSTKAEKIFRASHNALPIRTVRSNNSPVSKKNTTIKEKLHPNQKLMFSVLS